MNYSRNIKRSKIKDELQRKIVEEQYAFAERLPGIHELSREYSVSYVTASKALKLLEHEGYLRCQRGVGNFVCYVKPTQPASCKVVNFITPHQEHYVPRYLFSEGKKLFKQAGWQVKLLEIGNAGLTSVISEINSPDAYSIIMGIRPIWENFTATLGHVTNRAVVLGELSGNNEITSIIADEPATVQMCLKHFKSRGRTKVALVCTDLHSELELFRIAAWRSEMLKQGHDFNWINQHCFNVNIRENRFSPENVRQLFRKWLKNGLNGADAVILPSFLVMFMEECKHNSIGVPDDLDVVFIGNDASYNKYPGVHLLDNNIEAHVQYAFEILENRFSGGPRDQGVWYFCPPKGIISSTQNIAKKQRRKP